MNVGRATPSVFALLDFSGFSGTSGDRLVQLRRTSVPGGSITYLADQTYTPQNGAGAVDGTPTTISIGANGGIVEGTNYQGLYGTQREGLTEYRFDVPNGVYLLTMQFAELEENGPGFRVFTVAAEGKPLLQNFDIYATVEKNYALTYQFAVPVTDGQLNVTFTASVGQTTVATIGVAATTPDKVLLRYPLKVTGLGGLPEHHQLAGRCCVRPRGISCVPIVDTGRPIHVVDHQPHTGQPLLRRCCYGWADELLPRVRG